MTCLLVAFLVAFIAGCGQEVVTAPLVVSTVPANGATNVVINTAISATFNMPMNAATITASSFTVTAGGTSVAGAVTYSGVVAVFTPASALAYGTVYTGTITTGAKNLGGTSLLNNYVWTFTTIAPPPTVISTVPVNGATSVPIGQILSATFSVAMNPATIGAGTFKVTGPGGVAVAGAVTYSGVVATFTPAVNLSYNEIYTATITTGAADLAGTPLASNYVWTFTTITPPPLVIATVPLAGATSVPIGQVLTATFNEPMSSATIDAATFTVTGPGGVAVAGAVTYSGVVATFTPTVPLKYSAVYTATITTGAEDLAGTALASNKIWTFTTISSVPTVIATVPANGATNVPIGQVLSATFSEAMNPATIDAATFKVTGPGGVAVAGAVTYAGTVATFTPAASLKYSAAYTATITTGAEDLAGTGLAANYVWTFTTITPAPTVISTVPVNGATGVPLNQVLTANFSESMYPPSISAASFTVTGPGGVAVAGAVTYTETGSVATFTPAVPLDYASVYTATITTGAEDLAGTPLATNYVWSFTTISPALAVIATVPVNGATGVPANQVLSATFNEPMKCVTLTSTTFTVAGPGATPVAGSVACAGAVATFTPADPLAFNTLFTATITTGAMDLSGTTLSTPFTWSFLTVPAPTPPTVISTMPANGATGVPINQALTATFSVAMDPATIDGTTFTLAGPGAVAVTGVVTYVAAGSVATFTPAEDLAASTVYTATITTGARDLQNVALVKNYVWTFTTAAAQDKTRPTVISTIPADLATDVPFDQIVSATFSKAMNPVTITSANFTLQGPGNTAVAGLVAYAGVSDSAVFVPAADLKPSTLYTATITNNVADLAGNTLLDNYVWTFTTAAAVIVVPPELVSTVPENGAQKVAIDQAVSATFSKAMNPLTITTGTFQLTGPGATVIDATVAYDPITFIATLTPVAPLKNSTTYTAKITGATDLAGTPLGNTGAPNPWTFTTGAAIIPPPVNLGTAALFGAFGGPAGVTNQGTETIVNGDIGTTGVSTLITGFNDDTVVVAGVPQCVYTETPLNIGLVNGTIDTAPPPPTVGCPNEGTAATYAIAAQAAADALTAYNTLVAFPNGLNVATCPGCGGGSAGELGNRTLAPGIYKSAPGSYGITQGDLTLDAKGDANAFWVFQMATTLTVGTPQSNRTVLLVNGAQAKNVYWQVGSSATINGVLGGGTMEGTIIAHEAISGSTAGVAQVTTINGRLLALGASTTIVNTVINVPAP
jgi:hypothetical protein